MLSILLVLVNSKLYLVVQPLRFDNYSLEVCEPAEV